MKSDLRSDLVDTVFHLSDRLLAMVSERRVRYALACRDATNQALKGSEILKNSGFGWLRHDKLKHIGHTETPGLQFAFNLHGSDRN